MARQSAAGPLSQRPGPDAAIGNSSRGVILLVVALILGVIILNKTDAGGSGPSVEADSPVTTEAKSGSATTSSTRAPRQPAEIKVLAANGSGVAGLGSRTGDRLTAAGYNSLAPTNTDTEVATSVVAFTPGFDLEAFYVALALGLPPTSVQTLEGNTSVPDTKGADIVVLVGPDLDVTAPAAGGATTPTTVFGVTTTLG
ncbi:MAG: LytR C-terminal domain-containing protein [Acidimicrobiia bacterium]|nr:LytR C-terminal domain-containing protein [Acidimicrobiia bacterium]